MRDTWTRRVVLGCALTLASTLLAGCQSNEIPLVEFPKGAPPPPPASKDTSKLPQGANTSQGDPSTMH